MPNIHISTAVFFCQPLSPSSSSSSIGRGPISIVKPCALKLHNGRILATSNQWYLLRNCYDVISPWKVSQCFVFLASWLALQVFSSPTVILFSTSLYRVQGAKAYTEFPIYLFPLEVAHNVMITLFFNMQNAAGTMMVLYTIIISTSHWWVKVSPIRMRKQGPQFPRGASVTQELHSHL